MRGFLSKFLVFALVTSVALLAGDYVLSRWMRRAHHPNSEIWYEVMEGKVDADVIALGSSRANTAFYPPVVDSVLDTYSWNLGVLGHHFEAENLRYEMFRLHNRKPRLVVQFVDPQLFYANTSFDRVQFLPWFWDRAFRKGIRENFGSGFFYKNAIPFVRYHSFLPWEVSSRDRRTERGFHTYESERDDPYTPFYQEVFFQDDDLPERFIALLRSLKKEGIAVVMVNPPEYGRIVYQEGQREAMRSCMDSIALITGTPYLDYTGMDLCADSTCFIDTWHLNLKGALVFSDSLSNDILRLRRAGALPGF